MFPQRPYQGNVQEADDAVEQDGDDDGEDNEADDSSP
jgi:hypothetical protein